MSLFTRTPVILAAAALCLASFAAGASAQEPTLNIYSARHYQTDQNLYDGFAKAQNVKINRVDSDDAGILQRLKAEGSASPADVVLLVDAARLARADEEGLFAPIKSAVLEKNIPAQYHAKTGPEGATWFGFSTRARVIVYNKISVKRDTVDTYLKLADPQHKGQLCTRSGSHPYNLSLFSMMAEHLGPVPTEQWLKGLVANMARTPKGGDTDQIKAVASGECQIALTNSYYFARLLRSKNPEDRKVAERVGVVFPDQKGNGTHVNIAGGAVAKNSKNKALAQAFLEYLSSPEAQHYFADGNNEWPVVPATKQSNAALTAMTGGKGFKADVMPISVVGNNQTKVQQMLDRVGYP